MLPDSFYTVFGLVFGIVFVVPTICMIRKRGLDDWAWPFFLASLPVWYMLFGVLAGDANVIALEALVGLPYFLTGYLSWRTKSRFMLCALGFAWLSHGLYDYYHDVFFTNAGVFAWYPMFCAVVDIAVGGYLLHRAFTGVDKPCSKLN
ncbi:hypothetical protein EY643_01445 [Halioglobus maricola]|uniref:Uncharacterized protein n=1 Tax=Halioglobus maricola TaxID=2601894 RepID=A0A5P9NF81_9GAMM|nr:hypothetical protein [Halioglobus maricola]QFU74422.1 hypothetical protein EY643_01445 [Halioglobus maricola]